MLHALTIDVEDWHESFGRQGIPPALLNSEPRVEAATRRVLEAMSRHSARATFFVLGTVAEKFPALVKEIVRGGHRVGCHGWEHRALDLTTPRQFREHLSRARGLLQDLSGQPVLGYRAPWFSLSGAMDWARDAIRETGFTYDSSVFPVWNPFYGDARAPLEVTRDGAGLHEVPLAVAALGPVRLPVAGGFYWRLLPFGVLRWGLDRIESEGRPAVLYLHPWELDSGQPRVWMGPAASLIHYLGLGRMPGILERVLESWRLGAIEEVFPQVCEPLVAKQSA